MIPSAAMSTIQLRYDIVKQNVFAGMYALCFRVFDKFLEVSFTRQQCLAYFLFKEKKR